MKNSNIKVILVAVVLSTLGLLAITNLKLGSPEKTAPSSKDLNSSIPQQAGLKVGDTFSDFSLTEVDGRTITNGSLKDKPAIVWFTTSWCVPCQVGARVVAPLDKELGDNAFNVLVIFVDPKEKDADLINWRKQFANPDWMVAFDNELTNLAKRINLKFLDSKFILDKNGLIKNIDFKQADENYLNTIKQIVKENS